MNKELKIDIKRISIEQYEKENNITNNVEVLVMNYDDIIFEDYPQFVKIEREDKNSDIDIEDNGVQETIFTNRDFKVEDEDLCDTDTKQNILVTFEKDNVDDGIEKENYEEVTKSDPNEKKIICYQCGFRAKKKHHLLSHIQLAHKDKKEVQTNFDCEYCMFQSKYKHSLGQHMARFHMDKIEKDGSASTKPKNSFYTKGTNIMDHSTLVKGSYDCNYCSYTTPKRNAILKHTAVHTVYMSKVLQCPKCPKKFTERVLPVHINKVHNPEGVFNCPKCSYTTTWKNNLRRHFKQNKDRETCKPFQSRTTPKQMAQKRLEGKAPPARKRRKKDTDSW